MPHTRQPPLLHPSPCPPSPCPWPCPPSPLQGAGLCLLGTADQDQWKSPFFPWFPFLPPHTPTPAFCLGGQRGGEPEAGQASAQGWGEGAGGGSSCLYSLSASLSLFLGPLGDKRYDALTASPIMKLILTPCCQIPYFWSHISREGRGQVEWKEGALDMWVEKGG